tara:strand:+ start:266 stop:565 length:300 start_codon:yes stop_codon:yes gene_type:complete
VTFPFPAGNKNFAPKAFANKISREYRLQTWRGFLAMSQQDNSMSQEADNRIITKGKFADSDPLGLILEALATIRFGAIQLTVHEGKLVQMDVTEKRRFT